MKPVTWTSDKIGPAQRTSALLPLLVNLLDIFFNEWLFILFNQKDLYGCNHFEDKLNFDWTNFNYNSFC